MAACRRMGWESWRRMDAEALLSMTDAALVTSHADLYRMLEMRENRIERLQGRLQERVDVDRAARRTADASRGEIKKLEFRVKLDRLALEQLKDQVKARTKRSEGQVERAGGDAVPAPDDACQHVVPGRCGYGERGEAASDALEAAPGPASRVPHEALAGEVLP